MTGENKCGAGVMVAAGVVTVLLVAAPAWAAEAAPAWRGIYDIIMKWINFGILMFLIVRLAKGPLGSFFSDKKTELTARIDTLAQQKKEAVLAVEKAVKDLADSGKRLDALKAHIAAQGEREKQKLIQDAREQSRLLLESARRKVRYRIDAAKASFRSELIDAAVKAAAAQLPSQLTEADNQKMLNLFMEGLQSRNVSGRTF